MCVPPVAIAVTPEVRPATCIGEELSVVVPLPNWPFELLPQHFAAPDTTAQAWPVLAAMAVTLDVRPVTWVAEDLEFVVASPSCPELLLPQHFAAPDIIAQAVSDPTLIAVATGLQDEGPVKAPVVVLNDTPAGSVPLYV